MPSADIYVVGVDLGGTQIRAALADEQGQIINRIECATESRQGFEQVLENLVASIQTVSGKAEIKAVGVAFAGAVNSQSGLVYTAPSMPGWDNVNLRDILQARLDLPVAIGNDTNLAALGEWQFGAGRSYQNVVYLAISTGVGAGVIADNRLLLGVKGGAGEIGHITIDPNGPRCTCGNFGCLVLYCCGGTFYFWSVEALKAGRESLLTALSGGDISKIRAPLVAEAAKRGDALSIEIVERVAKYLGLGIINLVRLYDPEVVIIGGGIMRIGPMLWEPMRTYIAEHLPENKKDIVLVRPSLGDDAGLYGAVALALQ